MNENATTTESYLQTQFAQAKYIAVSQQFHHQPGAWLWQNIWAALNQHIFSLGKTPAEWLRGHVPNHLLGARYLYVTKNDGQPVVDPTSKLNVMICMDEFPAFWHRICVTLIQQAHEDLVNCSETGSLSVAYKMLPMAGKFVQDDARMKMQAMVENIQWDHEKYQLPLTRDFRELDIYKILLNSAGKSMTDIRCDIRVRYGWSPLALWVDNLPTLDSDDDDTYGYCGICWQDLRDITSQGDHSVKRIACGHVFGRDCLVKSLMNTAPLVCPVCLKGVD